MLSRPNRSSQSEEPIDYRQAMGHTMYSNDIKNIRMIIYLLIAISMCIPNLTRSAAQSPVPAAPLWPAPAREKGYVVFQHSTLQILSDDHIPLPEAIVDKVSVELAQGEHESVFFGVHNFSRRSDEGVERTHSDALIDVWAEPTIDLDVKVYYRNMELHQLVYGNVIGRIDVGQTIGFWFTFKATHNTPTGTHVGKIIFVPANGPPTELELQVLVRPFVLHRARAAFAAYFTQSDDKYVGYRRRFAEDEVWRKAIYSNMAEYGMTSVDFSARDGVYNDTGELLPKSTRAAFDRELDLTITCGLVDLHTPVVMHFQPPRDREMAPIFAQQLNDLRARKGWPQFLHYLIDEPTYPRPDVRKRAIWWRGTPFKIVTSLNMAAAYGHGDVHDVWIVFGGQITPALRSEAHRLGAEVWTYTYNISNGQPLRNRYFAGLYTWAQRAGGNWIWAYYRNLFYNRLAWSHNSDNVMYPGVGYEMRREGIDDFRYIQMLEDTIAAHSDDLIAIEADAWLQALRDRLGAVDPHNVVPGDPLSLTDYDVIRRKAAGYIERLGPAPPRNWRPWSESGLKDEAHPFRDKPLNQCIAALASTDPSVRRSAALALRELGAEAAPAVEALSRLLKDQEARIPAIRALEAIGARASAAAANVAALLSDPDPFIRVAAAYALGAMGPIAAKPLRVAGDDPIQIVAETARKQLITMGLDQADAK